MPSCDAQPNKQTASVGVFPRAVNALLPPAIHTSTPHTILTCRVPRHKQAGVSYFRGLLARRTFIDQHFGLAGPRDDEPTSDLPILSHWCVLRYIIVDRKSNKFVTLKTLAAQHANGS